MRRNQSWLFIGISEDLDYVAAASQVWYNTWKDNFLRKKYPNISWREATENCLTCIFVELEIWL